MRKNRENVKIVILVVMGLVLFSAPSLYARNSADSSIAKSEEELKILDEVMKELGLTAAQQKQIKDIRKKYRAKEVSRKAELMLKRAELEKELTKENVDKKKINSISTEVNNIENARRLHKINAILDIKKVLTSEQYKKLQILKKKKREQQK